MVSLLASEHHNQGLQWLLSGEGGDGSSSDAMKRAVRQRTSRFAGLNGVSLRRDGVNSG